MRRSGAQADGAASAMEIANLDPGGLGYPGDLFLSAMQRPLAGQQPRVFIAVAVPQHDLLDRVFAAANIRLQMHTPPHKRMLQILRHDSRGCFQIFDRLKQGDHMDLRRRSLWCFPPETNLPSKEINREKVGHPSGHTDDQRADTTQTEPVPVLFEYAITTQDRIRFRSNRNIRRQKRSA